MPTIIEPTKPDIERSVLLNQIGYEKNSRLSCSTDKKIEKWEKGFTKLITPSLTYKTHKIKNLGHSLQLENNTVLNSPILAKMMRECNEIVCFLATIGNRIDQEIIRLTDQKCSSEAYILDTIGSVAVEKIVNDFQNRIKAKMRAQNGTTTLRMSPGYCDWPIQEQKKLFSLLDAGKIGVCLSDACLMQPRKTISGIFGILPHTADKDIYNPCDTCRKSRCPARRTEMLN